MDIQPSKPIHILYAEDDTDDIGFFKDLLSELNLGTELTTFPHACALLTFLDKYPSIKADIIFLDINMPFVSGLECLLKIRLNKIFDSIPVIMLSTSTLEMEKAFNYNANLFLSKNIFYNTKNNILSTIFAPGWRERLLKTNKEMFSSFIGHFDILH